MKTAVVGFKREKLRRPTTSGLLWIFALTLIVAGNARDSRADEPLLVAHWKLATDARDSSGNDLHATNHGVRFSEAPPSSMARTLIWRLLTASISARGRVTSRSVSEYTPQRS